MDCERGDDLILGSKLMHVLQRAGDLTGDPFHQDRKSNPVKGKNRTDCLQVSAKRMMLVFNFRTWRWGPVSLGGQDERGGKRNFCWL